MANLSNYGFWNSFIAPWDDNFFNNLYYDFEYDIPSARGEAYNRIYKNYPAPEGGAYAGAALSGDDNVLMNAYGTDLTNERKETFARWISTNANIDAEWDAYVRRYNALHAAEWLALKQKSYDIWAK
jgi:hypothetical protein